ncbi:MAG: N-acetyl-alpha-D-glucosaminyl L-malate synthase BshA [Bacteroidia bacterium]
MKIGIVCYPTYGGSGVVATELGKALAKKSHQIHFISYKQPARLDHYGSNLFYHEVGILNYPLFEYPPYELALISKLVDVIKFTKLDLLHVHYAIPHAFAAYMAKQILLKDGIQIPVVTTLHGTDITLVGKDPSYEPAVTWSINNSDAVTSVSQFLKDETYKFFKVEKDIAVIPNFIDLKRFSKKPKEHFKKALAPHGEKIIVHTSNFRKVKRVQDVMTIFENVRNEIPAKLLFIGDGPERTNVEAQCRKSPYCSDVRFLGKIDAVEEVLSICDLFILPSESESFGLAALEAMACQVPVISSNAGGLPEVNTHGVTGYVSDVGDTDSMTKFALEILRDEAVLTRFKKNALIRAKEFDIKKIMPLYVSLYTELIERINSPVAH